MAFAGLKKQINKANQYVTEKMGGAEGTKLDLDFMEMERKTDVTVELVEELQTKTKEYLQPNPTARAKMAAVKGISKLSGQAKSNTYPQPEGLLADCMLMFGKKLGEDSIFAQSLIEFGESLKQMADVKYSLDDNIKQNVLEPLHHLQTKDLKEVMHHRKKLQGRRLDFDCKRRRQAKGSHYTDDEIKGAEEKFAESLHLAQMGMFNLLANDVEQVSQMVTFAEGLLEFHQQCTEVLKVLVETLQEKKEEAEARPKSEFTPKTLQDLNIEAICSSTDGLNGGRFAQPSSDFNRARNSKNSLYSSQQNLSQRPGSTGSNFSRTKFYGSQQNLQTSTTGGFKTPVAVDQNRNPVNSSNGYEANGGVDPWLNAWDSPTPIQPPPTAAPRYNASSSSSSSASQFRMPGPPASGGGFRGGGGSGGYALNNTNNNHNLNQTNNNNGHFVHSNGNSNYSSNGMGNGRQFSNNLSSTTTSAYTSNRNNLNNNYSDPWSASPLPSPMRSPARTPVVQKPAGPCCTALYDFDPENPGELGFKENDIIQLINKVDENWFEGSVNGRTGYFPQTYVTVTVPLPN